jgi:hypothetical protein
VTLTPQLNNQDNWFPLYSQTFTRATSPTGAKIPIPTIRVPIQPDEHLLAITVASATAPDRYYVGGYASFWIQVQLGAVGGSFARAGDSERLQLNEINLVRSPKLSDQYELRVTFPRYLDDMALEVYEYIGLGEPTIEGKLDSIHDQLIQ